MNQCSCVQNLRADASIRSRVGCWDFSRIGSDLMPYRRALHPKWIRDYYASDVWTERKHSFYRTHQRRCTACFKRGKDIQLHHRQYSGIVGDRVVVLERHYNWGSEPDEWLTPLCGRCHKSTHAVDDSGKFKTLAEATDWWISHMQRRKARHRRYSKMPLVGWIWR